MRLVVNGQSLKSLVLAGKAGVREGTSLTFEAIWIVPSEAVAFDLVVGDAGAATGTIPLVVGP